VLESLRPATLVLAAVCAWCVAVLGLTLFGLGGRVGASDATEPARPLPKVNLTASKPRLGSLDQYSAIGQRPLLMPNRKPQAIAAAPGEAGSSDLNARLTSVMITPHLQLAILTLDEGGISRRVRVGDTVEGTNWHLSQLEPRRAVFDGPSGQKVLDLRVYDGQGGLAPTAVARAAGNRDTANGDEDASGSNVNTPLGPSASGSPPGSPIASARPSPPPGQVPPPQVPPPQADKPMSQQEQVEAIRRRIEARRAQMRAQPPAGDANK
jgi:general secretion pathway protein N